MHLKVMEQWQREADEQKTKDGIVKDERNKKREQKKKTKEYKKSKIKEPLIHLLIKLAGGVKLDIKRVHFRYEDDYF